ncbi:EamA family transporter [Candidatus Woesearchaeota archaeon]|nr:EamA family transporter [Candidatus Woesearchaeota archaeon]
MLSLGIISGLAAMFGWGIADFLQSIPVRKMGPYKTMFVSNVFAVLLTFPAIFFLGSLYISSSNLALLLLGGIFQVVAIEYFYKSMEIGELSIVSPISASYSIITVFLVVIFLGKELSMLTFLSIVLIVLGIVLTSTDIRKISQLKTVKGVKESLVPLVLWGVYFFFSDLVAGNNTLYGINFPETNYLVLFFYSNLINNLLMLVYVLFLRKGWVSRKDFSGNKVLPVLFISSVFYAIIWLVVNYAISKGFVSIVAPISSLYPVVIVILALLFYKEKLVLNQKIGIATVLAGLFLISL